MSICIQKHGKHYQGTQERKSWERSGSRKKGENQEQRIGKGSEYLLAGIFTCYPTVTSSLIVTKIIHTFEEHMEIIANYKFTCNMNT